MTQVEEEKGIIGQDKEYQISLCVVKKNACE
jgi:hypothetical protein